MPSSVAFAPPNQPTAVVAPESRRDVTIDAKEFKAFGADGLTFDDLLDVINPLHHLPIVGFIYRSITGDTISPASRVTGGALFGGLVGFAASVADTVLEEISGKDVGGHIVARMDDAQGQPGEPKEAPWSATASLRHDAHEYDDEFNERVASGTDLAAREGQAGGPKSQTIQTVSLRHDAHDNEDGVWEDPDTMANTENVAAVQGPIPPQPTVATPVAGNPARNRTRPGPINGATAAGNHPVTLGATLKNGPRAFGTALPKPQALAANPAVITALRKGVSHNFQPGGGVNSDTWLNLMNNVNADRSGSGAPTGASGLTSATLAKALATYGAAEAPAPKAKTGLIRP
jgi:hypothetical protein